MLYVVEPKSYRTDSPDERVHDVLSFAPRGHIGDGGRLEIDFQVAVRCGVIRQLYDGQEIFAEPPPGVAVCADCLEERS